MFVNFENYYPEIKGVEIPEENFLGIFSSQAIKNSSKTESLIYEALENPIGCSKLDETLKPTDRVLILSDDNTRDTPVDKILSILLPILLSLGIKKENITILMALGTHRPMNQCELEEKLGVEIIHKYKVINHTWDIEEDNMYYGKTSRNIEVWGNKLLHENDFIIGLGHIVPHRVAGFSGGGKIVQPGVSNGKSTGETHWLSALVKGSEIIGKRDNLVREQIDEAARLMGLNFIINVVQGIKGNTIGVFAGDLTKAHRKGCNLAKDVYGVKIPKADIIITDSYPADIELWQAAKGIYSSELVVKKDGFVILVTPCPEGVAKTHPEIMKFGYLSLEKAQELLDKKELVEKSVASHLVHCGRVIKEKAQGFLICPNISDNIKEKLGFLIADSAQEALDYALERKGKDASVVVMIHAGEILPLNE